MINILKVCFLLFVFTNSLYAQDLDLANEYFQKGEFEKANELYKKLAKDNNQANLVHDNYLQTMLRLKDVENAEKFLKKQIKTNPNQITYKADLAFLGAASKKEETPDFQELINEALRVEANVYILQNYLYKKNEYKLIVELLEKAQQQSNEKGKYSLQLARAYLYNGSKEKMLEQVILYGLLNNNEQYVQATIQDNIKDEAEIDLLEKLLYTKIQENPNETYYPQLLIWHFIQQKDFKKAFNQARAIDRRLKLEGQKIIEIAAVAFQNKDYKNAATMYDYILKEYPAGQFYSYAKRWFIQTKEEIVKTSFPVQEEDIRTLINEYETMFLEIGKSGNSLEALRNVALLHAFYLNNPDKAIEILQEAISIAGANQFFKDQCKLDMGDIYILKNEPWESTLLYMQVEKTQKEDKLGEAAKLRNAKNHYFNGEFALAKDILDILKKATTREIANDAMNLSLLIQDNTGLDTSEVAMQAYAAVELQLFQNKNQEALDSLKQLYKRYKTHYLADEILWLQAQVLVKMNNVDNSIELLDEILKTYPQDLLADDALYQKAKLVEETKKDKLQAMKLYRELLQKYPGSIYCADARKKYRILRGDMIN